MLAQVDVYTAYYDPGRCFKETLDGSFRVLVRGSWFPRQLLGRCTAFCAYLRCALAALSLSRCGHAAAALPLSEAYRVQLCCTPCRERYDVVFVDQVSFVIPVLRRLTSAKVW